MAFKRSPLNGVIAATPRTQQVWAEQHGSTTNNLPAARLHSHPHAPTAAPSTDTAAGAALAVAERQEEEEEEEKKVAEELEEEEEGKEWRVYDDVAAWQQWRRSRGEESGDEGDVSGNIGPAISAAGSDYDRAGGSLYRGYSGGEMSDAAAAVERSMRREAAAALAAAAVAAATGVRGSTSLRPRPSPRVSGRNSKAAAAGRAAVEREVERERAGRRRRGEAGRESDDAFGFEESQRSRMHAEREGMLQASSQGPAVLYASFEAPQKSLLGTSQGRAGLYASGAAGVSRASAVRVAYGCHRGGPVAELARREALEGFPRCQSEPGKMCLEQRGRLEHGEEDGGEGLVWDGLDGLEGSKQEEDYFAFEDEGVRGKGWDVAGGEREGSEVSLRGTKPAIRGLYVKDVVSKWEGGAGGGAGGRIDESDWETGEVEEAESGRERQRRTMFQRGGGWMRQVGGESEGAGSGVDCYAGGQHQGVGHLVESRGQLGSASRGGCEKVDDCENSQHVNERACRGAGVEGVDAADSHGSACGNSHPSADTNSGALASPELDCPGGAGEDPTSGNGDGNGDGDGDDDYAGVPVSAAAWQWELSLSDRLTQFLDIARAKREGLVRQMEESKQQFQQLATFLGEPPSSTPQAIFGALARFAEAFDKSQRAVGLL
ncbi:unnamed protein product [Closterium sp. NIES-65]|nr:unnamed protein product [Closterium sp. NIES-65]